MASTSRVNPRKPIHQSEEQACALFFECFKVSLGMDYSSPPGTDHGTISSSPLGTIT